jgi:hypothetical protein
VFAPANTASPMVTRAQVAPSAELQKPALPAVSRPTAHSAPFQLTTLLTTVASPKATGFDQSRSVQPASAAMEGNALAVGLEAAPEPVAPRKYTPSAREPETTATTATIETALRSPENRRVGRLAAPGASGIAATAKGNSSGTCLGSSRRTALLSSRSRRSSFIPSLPALDRRRRVPRASGGARNGAAISRCPHGSRSARLSALALDRRRSAGRAVSGHAPKGHLPA